MTVILHERERSEGKKEERKERKKGKKEALLIFAFYLRHRPDSSMKHGIHAVLLRGLALLRKQRLDLKAVGSCWAGLWREGNHGEGTVGGLWKSP